MARRSKVLYESSYDDEAVATLTKEAARNCYIVGLLFLFWVVLWEHSSYVGYVITLTLLESACFAWESHRHGTGHIPHSPCSNVT